MLQLIVVVLVMPWARALGSRSSYCVGCDPAMTTINCAAAPVLRTMKPCCVSGRVANVAAVAGFMGLVIGRWSWSLPADEGF